MLSKIHRLTFFLFSMLNFDYFLHFYTGPFPGVGNSTVPRPHLAGYTAYSLRYALALCIGSAYWARDELVPANESFATFADPGLAAHPSINLFLGGRAEWLR
jgi:hypothetical protein